MRPPVADVLAGVVWPVDPGARWAAAVFVCFDSENRATVFDEVFLEGCVTNLIRYSINLIGLIVG